MSIECPICTEVYTRTRKPKVASCGHSLCSECVKQLIARNALDCPQCKVITNWAKVPDNYAIIHLIDSDDPLIQLAKNQASELFARLVTEEKELREGIAALEQEERDKRREREELRRAIAQRPLPRQVIPEERKVQPVLPAQAYAEDRRETELQRVIRVIATYRLIHEQIVLNASTSLQELQMRPPREFPDELKKLPVHFSIEQLQDSINRSMRLREVYGFGLGELQDFSDRLKVAMEEVRTIFTRQKSELIEETKKMGEESTQAAIELAETNRLIQTLEDSAEMLRAEYKQIVLEKEENLLRLARDAKALILELNTELQAFDSSTKTVLDSRVQREQEAREVLRDCSQFLSSSLRLEQSKVAEVHKRLEARRSQLEKRHCGEVIETGLKRDMNCAEFLSSRYSEACTLREEVFNERKHIADALLDAKGAARQVEAERARWKEMSKKVCANKAVAEQSIKKLEADFTLAEVKLNELGAELSSVLEEVSAQQKALDEVNATYATHFQYGETVLSPLLDGVNSALVDVTTQLRQTEASFRSEIEVLEKEYNRLAVHSVSVTPFVTTPATSNTAHSSPARTSGGDSRHGACLGQEKQQLEKECAELNQQLKQFTQEANAKHFEVSTTKSTAMSDMVCAFLVSLAGGILLFSQFAG